MIVCSHSEWWVKGSRLGARSPSPKGLESGPEVWGLVAGKSSGRLGAGVSRVSSVFLGWERPVCEGEWLVSGGPISGQAALTSSSHALHQAFGFR